MNKNLYKIIFSLVFLFAVTSCKYILEDEYVLNAEKFDEEFREALNDNSTVFTTSNNINKKFTANIVDLESYAKKIPDVKSYGKYNDCWSKRYKRHRLAVNNNQMEVVLDLCMNILQMTYYGNELDNYCKAVIMFDINGNPVFYSISSYKEVVIEKWLSNTEMQEMFRITYDFKNNKIWDTEVGLSEKSNKNLTSQNKKTLSENKTFCVKLRKYVSSLFLINQITFQTLNIN